MKELKRYLDHLSIMRGYPSYSEWYDWICREGQIPVVVAMEIESMNRNAFRMWLDDLQICNYSGEGIVFIDKAISKLKNEL